MNNKFIIVKNLIPKEFAYFFTHALLRNIDISEDHSDAQVPSCKSILDHEIIFETLQERLWERIESDTSYKLIPTYSYSRLYTNGDKMEKHKDRPACEISVTIQLGRSHHYSYPIYMDGHRVELAEGDGIIYQGMEVEHWRDECNGPDNYYSGQAFLHYVKADGEHSSEQGDNTKRDKYSFVKNRTLFMEAK